MNESPPPKWWVRLLLILLPIVLLVGCLETAGYLWEERTAAGPLGWTLVASRRLNLEVQGNPEQPYYLFEPNEDYEWEGIPVHIGSAGFRTEEFALPKPAGTYRILTIGDSTTFGWRVEQAETYGKQLEQELNSQNNNLAYEVINAGVPGWTLEASRNFLLDKGFGYEPDAIVLAITVVNDMTTAPPIKSENPLFAWLRDKTYGWSFVTTQLRFLAARQVGPEAIPNLNPRQDAKAYYPIRTDNPIYNTVWGFVADMAEASQAHNIPFYIIVFPTAFQVNSSNHPNTAQQVLSERAAAAGIPIIDLLPIYKAACAEMAADACEGYENALFADIWMHPNPAGHALAAQEILTSWTFIGLTQDGKLTDKPKVVIVTG